MKIREFWDSDYSEKGWKENYDNQEQFENMWHEVFIDCDILRFNGNDEQVVWITEYENEVLYYIPDGDLDWEMVEDILGKFYLNKDPENNGFMCLNDKSTPLVGAEPINLSESGNDPVLKYRGGSGYGYSFWQYVG